MELLIPLAPWLALAGLSVGLATLLAVKTSLDRRSKSASGNIALLAMNELSMVERFYADYLGYSYGSRGQARFEAIASARKRFAELFGDYLPHYSFSRVVHYAEIFVGLLVGTLISFITERLGRSPRIESFISESYLDIIFTFAVIPTALLVSALVMALWRRASVMQRSRSTKYAAEEILNG